MKLLKFTYKKVMSTNDVAIRKIRSGIEQGIIITNEQKKGRGRFGNKWISLKGNIFLSFFNRRFSRVLSSSRVPIFLFRKFFHHLSFYLF